MIGATTPHGTPPDTARLDGCPECMTRDNAPHTTEHVPHGVACHYVCRVCGCDWTTSWWGGDL